MDISIIELSVILGLALVGAYVVSLPLRDRSAGKEKEEACQHEWDTWSTMRESDLVFYQIRDCKHCNFAEVHMIHK